MIQSRSESHGCGATSFGTPVFSFHNRRWWSTISVSILVVNVQHVTKTTALSNRHCAFHHVEESCVQTRFTFHHQTSFSRMGFPHLVVCLCVFAMCHAIILFVWLESCDVNRSRRQKRSIRRIIVMGCHSVGVPVDGKAAHCRVMKKTVCRCDTLGNECGKWREPWSGCERRLQKRICVTYAPLMFRVCFLTF